MMLLAIIVIVCMQGLFIYWAKDSFKGITVRYDCSLSEISPDFPVEVKEQCRKLKAKYGRI